MLWTVAGQAPLSMGFPRRDTGVGCHFFLQGIFLTQGFFFFFFFFSDPGIEPMSSAQGSPPIPYRLYVKEEPSDEVYVAPQVMT